MKKRFILLLTACLAMGMGQAVVMAEEETAGTPETNALGEVTPEAWSEKYPEIVESYLANKDNDEAYSYVEAHPQIATLYEGMGFSSDYNSARGHYYTLDDVQATTRPHPLSNCLACKTADYVQLLNKYGTDFYSMSFEDAVAEIENPISCYDCHGNSPEQQPGAIRQDIIECVGEDFDSIQAANLACGQCHNEYYFEPENKSVTHPYSDVASMAPDAILEYYNEMEFTDYQNPRTGTNQIKVQHPELETFLGEGSLHKGSLSCADCHMEKVDKEDGTSYTSHTWISPLASESIQANTCAACHGDTDLSAKVKEIQDEITGREEEIADILVDLTEKLAEAVESGDYTDEELDAIRALNRDAQFYWDFVFVENSEGAHNSQLSRECLDKAESIANEALALFK